MASQAHIEIVVDSLKELRAEADRDEASDRPRGFREMFRAALNGNVDFVKALGEVRKRMREE